MYSLYLSVSEYHKSKVTPALISILTLFLSTLRAHLFANILYVLIISHIYDLISAVHVSPDLRVITTDTKTALQRPRDHVMTTNRSTSINEGSSVAIFAHIFILANDLYSSYKQTHSKVHGSVSEATDLPETSA